MSGFWNPLLSETLCKSSKWPALHYIHQNMQTGEWVASDNRVLLAELNGAIPMFEMWDATGNPVNVDCIYNDYEGLIERTIQAGIKTTAQVKQKGLFTFIHGCAVLTSDYNKVMKFIGDIGEIRFKDIYTAIYFISRDKQRRALIAPIQHDNVLKAKWNLLDTDESVLGTFNSWQEAHDMGEMLGCEYIIKVSKYD
jgi:hypothetical protein